MTPDPFSNFDNFSEGDFDDNFYDIYQDDMNHDDEFFTDREKTLLYLTANTNERNIQ